MQFFRKCHSLILERVKRYFFHFPYLQFNTFLLKRDLGIIINFVNAASKTTQGGVTDVDYLSGQFKLLNCFLKKAYLFKKYIYIYSSQSPPPFKHVLTVTV